MSYADTLLTSGEQVVLRGHQHWLSLLSRSRGGLFLWIVAIVLIVAVVVFKIGPGLTRDIPSYVAFGLLILGLIVLLYRFWQWRTQEYIVTNRRLLKVGGILNKHSADSELEKINDAILEQPLLGRMLNYGNLTILTAAEEAVDTYHMLHDPIEFKKTMLNEKHTLESGYNSRAMPPTPPLRADSQPAMTPVPQPVAQPLPQTAPAAPPPGMAQAAPPPPPAMAPMPVPMPPPDAPPPAAASMPAMHDAPAAPAAAVKVPNSSLDVTETLARLADLRDSGAITPEEYEAKKQELLGRL